MMTQHSLRTFYTLILTQVFSLIGSRISGLAISIWVFNQTGDATPLALVSFFFIVPQVVAAGFSGVLADRWDRRYVMMLSDAGQAVGTVLLFISFASGGFQLWHLYAVTFLQSIFGVFQGPAFQASVTMLVPDEKRDSANAIQQVTGPVAGIIAPAVAGFIYALVGVTGAILIDLGTFVVAVLVVFFVHIPRPEISAEGRKMAGTITKEMFDGFRYLWQRRALFWLMGFSTLVNFLVGGVMALETPYLLARTADEATLGVLLGVLNLGALAGGIVMSIWGGTRPRIHTIMISIFLGSIFLGLTGMAQTPLALGGALFAFMFMLPFANAAAMSMLQAKVAPDVQGRVFAATGQVAMLMMPIAFLLVGPLADQVFEPAVGQAGWSSVAPLVGSGAGAGMGLLLLICGLGTALLTALVYAVPAVRRIEADLPDFEAEVAATPAMPLVNPALIPDAAD
ncbi:MAG: MFS transporter [Anaerolineae bacterium]|nr:MFS transporter [Anaerolineae bacterium]